jgi:hypothetical protein
LENNRKVTRSENDLFQEFQTSLAELKEQLLLLLPQEPKSVEAPTVYFAKLIGSLSNVSPDELKNDQFLDTFAQSVNIHVIQPFQIMEESSSSASVPPLMLLTMVNAIPQITNRACQSSLPSLLEVFCRILDMNNNTVPSQVVQLCSQLLCHLLGAHGTALRQTVMKNTQLSNIIQVRAENQDPIAIAILTRLGLDLPVHWNALFRVLMNPNSRSEEKETALHGLVSSTRQYSLKTWLTGEKVVALCAEIRNWKKEDRLKIGFSFTQLISWWTEYPVAEGSFLAVQRELQHLASGGKCERGPPESIQMVEARCKEFLNGEGVSLFSLTLGATGAFSPTLGDVVGSCLVNLARNPSHRGKFVQQGGIKLALRCSSSSDASLAIALCSSSLNPKLCFPSNTLPSVVHRILSLFPEGSTLGRDHPFDATPQGQDLNEITLESQLSALRALTNLGCLPEFVEKHLSWIQKLDQFEFWTHSNEFIRCASWELLNNLLCVAYDNSIAQFLLSNCVKRSLFMRLAIAHVHPEETEAMRRASAGVLAMLASVEPAIVAEELLKRKEVDAEGDSSWDPFERLVLLLQDPVKDIVHRGLVTWLALMETSPEIKALAQKHQSFTGKLIPLKVQAELSPNAEFSQVIKQLIKLCNLPV